MIIELNLNLRPQALPRARITTRGKFASSYYAKKHMDIFKEYEYSILNALNDVERTYTREICLNAPKGLKIAVELIFTYQPNVSESKKKAKLMVDNEQAHTVKVDLDNLIKMMLDRSNGILYPDDCYIYKLSAVKKYGAKDNIYMRLEYEDTV